MRVLLAGGGSGGSATPVLAVADALRELSPGVSLVFVGTHDGPERALVEREGIPFVGVAAGKLRRYWSVENATDVLRLGKGLAESLRIVRRFRPDVGFGAGGFASVPPLIAVRLCRTPVVIHQQDVVRGLANRLLVPFASRITVAMSQSMTYFPTRRTSVRGNPVRRRIVEARADDAIDRLGLERDTPLVLITGGGTGALGLNRIVAQAAPDLIDVCQVLHLSGVGRGVDVATVSPRYQQREFLVEELPSALAKATVVVTRAGMATLSELSMLGKAAIVVPMPDSHQEANARAFAEAGAAIVEDQPRLTPDRLVAQIRALLEDPHRRHALAAAISRVMPRDAARRIAQDLLAPAGA